MNRNFYLRKERIDLIRLSIKLCFDNYVKVGYYSDMGICLFIFSRRNKFETYDKNNLLYIRTVTFKFNQIFFRLK